jgi:hypothetical protein
LRPESGFGDNTTAVLRGHVFKGDGPNGRLTKSSDVNATVKFPHNAALKVVCFTHFSVCFVCYSVLLNCMSVLFVCLFDCKSEDHAPI